MAVYAFTVSVKAQYLDQESDPARDAYLFAYTVSIQNTGDVTAQLISRHWIIHDAHNRKEEVRGLGVVGRQPLLKPGEVFEYSSGTSLRTPQGSMRGAYFCVAEDGTQFEAAVPEFVLALPSALH